MDSSAFLSLIVFCLIGHICTAVRIPPPPPPAVPPPPLGCVDAIYNIIDCLSFIRNGSDLAKPDVGCCEGLLYILDTKTECFCEALDNSEKFGVVLNVSKANSLPSTCGINNITVADCGTESSSYPITVSMLPPSPSPSQTPVSPPDATTPDIAPPPQSGDSGDVAPDPSPSNSNANAPVPAPTSPPKKNSSDSVRSISYVALLACLAAISLSNL